MKLNIQLIKWFPKWQGFYFIKLDPSKTNIALIYDWFLYIGFWEMRKFKNWGRVNENK